METNYVRKIAEKLNLRISQVEAVQKMHTEGATIPFLARYRKEATGNLDEVEIANIVEQTAYFNELHKRKETIVKTIEEAGKLTPELAQRIQRCDSATELEDIYLPYKPKRKKRGTQAIEKGLEPLAKLILEQEPVTNDE